MKATELTREQVRKILSSKPSEKAFMRHNARIVKPFDYEKGLYEMSDTATGWELIGGLNEAVEFLISA